MSSGQVRVFLLKTRSSPSDDYASYFEAHSFVPSFHPVLTHTLKASALSFLLDTLPQLGSDDASYGGLIFTSQRAVEALSVTVTELHASGVGLKLPPDFPLYVVGTATSRALRALEIGGQVTGEATGNGEALAAFILEDYKLRGRKNPLLFLVGEKRRDIIPRTLMDEKLDEHQRIEVVEKEVYETKERDEFKTEFGSELKACVEAQPMCIWVVVFSPQGCKAMLETLAKVNQCTRKWEEVDTERSLERPREFVRVAAIGPTTQRCLRDQFAEDPDVTAEKPNATSLGAAIGDFMRDHDAA